MASLAEALPAEITRVSGVRDMYMSMRGTPGLNVEFAIQNMTDAIARATRIAASGDVLEMLRVYEELKGFEE